MGKNRGYEKSMANLVTFGDMPPERHKELSAKGGIASGKARREKAEQIKVIEAVFLAEAVKNGIIDDIAAYQRFVRKREPRKKREQNGTEFGVKFDFKF